MATENKKGKESAHLATAKMRSLSISTKHSVEISRHLRFKSTTAAKAFLEEVVTLSKPVPFKRFVNDLGHKPGMASGRYPMKAAKEFLALIKSVEKNAEDLGLNSESLKIVHLLANKAAIPMTGGRTKGATKRTHLEIKVAEQAKKGSSKKSVLKSKPVKKAGTVVKETNVEKAQQSSSKTETNIEKAQQSSNKVETTDTIKGESQ